MRIVLMCVCLLIPYTASADSIVTWFASGELAFSAYAGQQNTGRVPPPGTPYQLTMFVDQASFRQTALSPPGVNCFVVDVTATLNLGGFDYGMGGFGFTHAQLPGNNCVPHSQETQFVMGIRSAPADSPWPVIRFGFMELWYDDLVNPNAFGDPTHNGGGFQIRDSSGSFIMSARHDLHAVDVPEQPVPVPEPGTMTLFGLGLAFVARKVRGRRHG